MDATRKQIINLLTIGVIVITAYVVFTIAAPKDDKLIVALCFQGITTLVAVLYSIFGDYIRNSVNGIRLKIETPKEFQSIIDSVPIGNRATQGYYYHRAATEQAGASGSTQA